MERSVDLNALVTHKVFVFYTYFFPVCLVNVKLMRSSSQCPSKGFLLFMLCRLPVFLLLLLHVQEPDTVLVDVS